MANAIVDNNKIRDLKTKAKLSTIEHDTAGIMLDQAQASIKMDDLDLVSSQTLLDSVNAQLKIEELEMKILTLESELATLKELIQAK